MESQTIHYRNTFQIYILMGMFSFHILLINRIEDVVRQFIYLLL